MDAISVDVDIGGAIPSSSLADSGELAPSPIYEPEHYEMVEVMGHTRHLHGHHHHQFRKIRFERREPFQGRTMEKFFSGFDQDYPADQVLRHTINEQEFEDIMTEINEKKEDFIEIEVNERPEFQTKGVVFYTSKASNRHRSILLVPHPPHVDFYSNTLFE
ncbi:hypothetical protein DFA_09322 [Cavenderia fasciculata]|uniref:Uncharacterized protein n=1 Tax=Cavenderia fasciculata TaxID=261658 RepID=F4Q7B0_CACFS|nr:uncharacterized protein DFA_09322 [Cavenderia fasciculata]EGG16292.1 hypothetical protein DFA_09322 [Cavenderia fasciculata]|eukprot:XP_004354676.1 hypothetical protein DFA_09322 [Cavenderia fasciculata]